MAEGERDTSVFDPLANNTSRGLGIYHFPVGTLHEIREAGMDPELVACCHSRAEGEIRGCPVWKTCQFNRKPNGGFKGEGPRNVGYYLKTSRSDGGRQKEDFIPCYGFVIALQGRMLAGRAARDRGEDHETIRIVAQEGEPIVVRKYFSVAKDGGNITGDIRMKSNTMTINVPVFLRPSENPGVTYDQQLRDREKRREEADADFEETRESTMRRLLREGEQDATVTMAAMTADERKAARKAEREAKRAAKATGGTPAAREVAGGGPSPD